MDGRVFFGDTLYNWLVNPYLQSVVEVKRRKPAIQKSVPPALPQNTSKVSKAAIQLKQTHTLPAFNPYPSVPTTQPYRYFNNSTAIGGKNVPTPFVTPFAVNHGPTFINLGSHSTVYSKPRLQTSSISKVEENTTSVQKPDSKDLHDLKVESETFQHPWEHAGYYNTPLQDRKTPTPSYNNSMACQAFMQMQGNYQKYPPTYLHGNMFPVPQLGYRNYGDPSENTFYQRQRHQAALHTNPYLPFSSFPPPPFLKPVQLASYPKTTEHFPKLPTMKREEFTTPSATTDTKSATTLESFSIFTSHVPKKEVNEKIISKLTADDEKECNSEEKK